MLSNSVRQAKESREEVMNYSNMPENSPAAAISAMKASLVSIIYFIIITIGNGLLVGIIYYEKDGMDPRKRNLFNRLITQVCWTRILHNITTLHFVAAKFVLGSTGMAMGLIAIGLGSTFVIATLVMLDLIMILKCLYMYKWPLMSGINDDFFATFFSVGFLIFGTLSFGLRYHCGEFHANAHVGFFAGKSNEEASQISDWALFICVNIPMALTVLTLLICPVLIALKKINFTRAVVPQQQQHQQQEQHQVAYNNTLHNDSLVTVIDVFTAVFALFIVIVPNLLARYEMVPFAFLRSPFFYMNYYFVASIVFPCIFYAKTPRARKYIYESVKDLLMGDTFSNN